VRLARVSAAGSPGQGIGVVEEAPGARPDRRRRATSGSSSSIRSARRADRCTFTAADLRGTEHLAGIHDANFATALGSAENGRGIAAGRPAAPVKWLTTAWIRAAAAYQRLLDETLVGLGEILGLGTDLPSGA
jgi:hypothetical protein